MPQSLSAVYVHLVFSTKERRALIPQESKAELHAYIAKTLSNHGCHAIAMNSMPDHIHILYNLSRSMTMAKVTQEVKTGSSRWLKQQGGLWYGWQSGYGSFSVSESLLGQVSNYINSQEEHHKKLSFQDEFRKLLIKHRIEYDENYVWD